MIRFSTIISSSTDSSQFYISNRWINKLKKTTTWEKCFTTLSRTQTVQFLKDFETNLKFMRIGWKMLRNKIYQTLNPSQGVEERLLRQDLQEILLITMFGEFGIELSNTVAIENRTSFGSQLLQTL